MYNSGRRGKRANDGYGILSQADRFNQTEYPIPIVTSFAVTNGSYVPLDDTAASTAGGQTIVVYGSGFAPGATIMVGGSTIGSVTYLDQGRLTFTSPANVSGSYTIIVMNANGGTGILVPGLVYSGVPTWSTAAGSIGTRFETTNVNSTFVATGDAPVTYSVLSGSLPPGTSLSTTGVLTGSAPVESGSTTYSFTIRATDGQLQDSDRSFSLTVNTDVVSWSTPTNNQVISAYEYAPISNVTASATSAAGYGVVYSANAVPTGITVNANTGVISGTVNTVGNTFTRLTATANTTTRTAIRDVVFNINPDVVTWNSPADGTQYTLTGGSAISNVTLSATSAAGFGVQYTANALPSGLTLSGSTISGTPTTAQTVNTLLTATANTTNRTATRTISWTISLGDLNWRDTTLALNATQPTTPYITDSSNNNTQLSIFGDARPSNFNPYQQGYYSNYFNGSSTGLTIPGTNGAFAFGTGNFTIEFWAYSTAFSGILCSIASSWSLRMESSGAITWYIGGANGGTTTSTVSLNTWNHFAVVRTGTGTNQFVIYVNGQPGYTNTRSDNITSTNTLYIGVSDSGNSGYYPGYISNFRVIKGTALYTGAFTPSTTPLTAVANTSLLTCQDNTFIDESPNNLTITRTGVPIVSSAHPFTTPTTVAYNTRYSTFFDGTGDFIDVPSNSVFNQTGSWTVEAWVYFPSVQTSKYFLHSQVTTGWCQLALDASGKIFIDKSGVGTQITAADAVVANRWYHVAMVSDGTNLRLYIDGVSQGSISTTSASSSGVIRSGAYQNSGGSGTLATIVNISNYRVTTTAVYTGNFTTPTSPLTLTQNAGTNISAITSGQTVLLTCQNSTLIDNSTNNFAITSFGQAQPIALSPFTMTTSNTTVTSLGSAYFDGTGDYLVVPSSSSHGNLGSFNFTVECWFYTTTISPSLQYIISHRLAAIVPFLFWLETSSLKIYASSDNGTWNLANSVTLATIVPNQWYHLAYTRSGSSFRVFLNGVQVHTFTSASSLTTTTNTLNIGGSASDTNAIFNGYISDVRLVKGTALYTANFLPPQVPATPVANTELLTVQTNGGATNNGFVDQSSFNNIITRSGNATQGTFSPYSHTGWSNYFDGTGDYLTVPASSNFVFAGDYTIEAWIYSSSTTWSVYSTGGSGATDQFSCDTGTLYWAYNIFGGGTANFFTSADVNKWTHVAACRSSGTTRLFKNGVVMATSTTNTSIGSNNTMNIGRRLDGLYLMNGYISNFRIVRGTALYTGAFTIPTSPLTAVANTLLLTCQDNRFIDESYNNFTITRNGDVSVQAFSPFGGVTSVPTSYSVYFDGNGDLYTINGNAGPIGTEDFTWECWVNISTMGGLYPRIFESGTSVSGSFQIYLENGTLVVGGNGTGTITSYGISSLTNQWLHLCVTRTGSAMRLFVNGVLRGYSASGGTNFTSSSTWRSMTEGGGLIGYLSNMRVVRGSIVPAYSTSSTTTGTTIFTPPTSPLTAISGTQFLGMQSNILIDNSTNYYSITTSGDTKPLPFNPFGQTNTTSISYSPSVNGGSMYFDGTGDKLTVANYPTLGFKANDFTIQCWFYTNAASTEQVIMTNGWAAFAPWLIRIDGVNTLRLNMSLNGGSWHVNEQSLGAVTPGQWYHVAVTRTSGVLRAFVNGIQTYTTDLTTSALYDGSQALTIGGRSDTTVPFNGYLSDAQIINGFSLYRANFVPPVAPATPTYTIGTTRGSSTLLLSGTSGGIIDMHGTNNLETLADVRIAPENPFESGFYSVYSDGNADYLTVPSATWTTLAGTFTVEFWALWTISPASAGSFMGVQSNGGWTLYNDTSSISPNVFGTGNIFNSTFSTSSIVPGRWYHIAVTRNSSNLMTMWVNGVSVGSTTTSTSYTQGAWAIHSPGNINLLNGFISNLRVTNTTLYTTTFTPPTSPLTAVSGTQLLTCQSRNFTDNSTNAATLTAFNTVAVRSFNPFKRNTGQSYFFDGTGDYLSSPASPQFAFGTGDYTIEAWVYRTDSGTQRAIVDLRGGSNVNILFYMNSSNQLVAFNSTSTWITSSSTIPLNQWTHVAITRSGTSARLFINGVIVGTATNSDNNVSLGAAFVGRQNGSTTNDWLGYIDDLRITRGVARYTANNQVNLTSTFEVK